MPLFIVIFALLFITIVFYLILSKEEKEKIEFFHVMAHRFRSPVSIVKWYIELLSDKSVGSLNDKQREYLDEIYKASERLNETIESLLTLLQLQSNKLLIKIQEANLKNLMNQVLSKLQFKIERHKLHLTTSYPQDKEIIAQTDPKLLSLVFQNIIENAIRYTPENGNININIDTFNDKISIEIKDDGYGIPRETRSRILSNSVNSKDMGFSLYLVKHVIGKLKGKISFKSPARQSPDGSRRLAGGQENKGTIFYITLPIHP